MSRTHHTSLRDPAAVAALRALLADDDLVHTVVSTYPTWEHFAAASPVDLAHQLGNKVPPTVPATMPVHGQPPRGIDMVTRYQAGYPAGLQESTSPPALLYVAGRLPDLPMVAVVGATSPSPTGVEIARSAGLAAAIRRIPLIVPLTAGCSLLAARTALSAGGRVVVVVPHGLGTGSSQQVLLDEIITKGGAVLTPFSPQAQVSSRSEDIAGTLAVLIATSVVLAEVATIPGAAPEATRTAVTTGRHLIVPAPPAAAQPGRYIPPTAFGTAIFSSPREWSEEYFGSSPRIQQRCANGLAPADSVVSNAAELEEAMVTGCSTAQAPEAW